MYNSMTIIRSANGYYIGRTFTDPKSGIERAGTRESGYYLTQRGGIKAVCEGLDLRQCDENWALYEDGDIPTRPGSSYQDKEFWKEF